MSRLLDTKSNHAKLLITIGMSQRLALSERRSHQLNNMQGHVTFVHCVPVQRWNWHVYHLFPTNLAEHWYQRHWKQEAQLSATTSAMVVQVSVLIAQLLLAIRN